MGFLLKIALCLMCASTFGQATSDKAKIADLFRKVENKYTHTNEFLLSSTYKLFASHSSHKVTESYAGVIVKKEDDYYSKIQETEFIRLKNLNIKIDNESKLMQLDKMDKNEGPLSYKISDFLSNFKDFSLTDSKGQWICTMTAPKVTFVPYSKIVVYIDKSDLKISKQIMYLLYQHTYKDAKGKKVVDYPRLEIEFSKLDLSIAPYLTKFEKSLYVTSKGRQYIPSKKYVGYQIVD